MMMMTTAAMMMMPMILLLVILHALRFIVLCSAIVLDLFLLGLLLPLVLRPQHAAHRETVRHTFIELTQVILAQIARGLLFCCASATVGRQRMSERVRISKGRWFPRQPPSFCRNKVGE